MIGASLDGLPDQESFAKKFGFTFPLIADPDGEVCSAYGVGQKGDKYAKRTTFVIGKDGRIRKIFEGVKVDGHVKAVLDSL